MRATCRGHGPLPQEVTNMAVARMAASYDYGMIWWMLPPKKSTT